MNIAERCASVLGVAEQITSQQEDTIMDAWQLIQKRIDEGWEFTIGQHVDGLQGYWAAFVPNDERGFCLGCEEPVAPDWEECGHSLYLTSAILMADRIAQGEDVKVPDHNEFL